MTTGNMIKIEPPELRFPFVLNKRIPCYILLSNKTDNYIAFHLLVTAEEYTYYIFRPNREILLPRSTCKVEATMLPQRKAPRHRRCEDCIHVQSIVTFAGATRDDITLEWFTKKSGNKEDKIALPVACVSPTSIERPLDHKRTTGELLEIKPSELRFPFELKKQISCSFLLSNKTDDHIAFKFMMSHWWKYTAQPSMAILLPRSACEVIVLMEDQRKAPPKMQCKEAFTVISVVTFAGATVKDVTHEMFFEESGNTLDEVPLEAICVSPPKHPSPVRERGDKRSSYWASATATLHKFRDGLARRRMRQSYIKINSDKNLMREPLLVSSSDQTGE